MTAKVASPASPAEDLACRGPLKAKRLLYTEDQLSFTRKVLQTPTKQGHSVCVSFIWLRSPLPLVFYLLLASRSTFRKAGVFPPVPRSVRRGPAFTLSTCPTLSSNPSWLQRRHIRPFDRTKARPGNCGQLVLLSGTAACRAFSSVTLPTRHYKPIGSWGGACLCVNPGPPTGFWKHFIQLSILGVLRPRQSHFYLLSPLTAEGVTGSRRAFCQFLSV